MTGSLRFRVLNRQRQRGEGSFTGEGGVTLLEGLPLLQGSPASTHMGRVMSFNPSFMSGPHCRMPRNPVYCLPRPKPCLLSAAPATLSAVCRCATLSTVCRVTLSTICCRPLSPPLRMPVYCLPRNPVYQLLSVLYSTRLSDMVFRPPLLLPALAPPLPAPLPAAIFSWSPKSSSPTADGRIEGGCKPEGSGNEGRRKIPAAGMRMALARTEPNDSPSAASCNLAGGLRCLPPFVSSRAFPALAVGAFRFLPLPGGGCEQAGSGVNTRRHLC
jgi:hypothetical protein